MFAVRELKSSLLALMAAQAQVVNISLVNQCSEQVRPIIIGRQSHYQLEPLNPTDTLVVPFYNDFLGTIFDGYLLQDAAPKAYLSLAVRTVSASACSGPDSPRHRMATTRS